MNDLERITGISPSPKSMDLGTVISAEMYSNSNRNKKENKNKNTFQQSTGPSDPAYENVWGQAPVFLSSGASHPGMKKDQEIPKTEEPYGRRLNWQQDKIVQIHVQLSIPKVGNRYTRASSYISIRTETDSRYMIFMVSRLTTANDETMRRLVKENDKPLITVLEDMLSGHEKNGVLTGRVKYKRPKGQKPRDYHKTNLPQALVSVFPGDDGYLHCQFYLLDSYYEIPLNEELTSKQNKIYSAQGFWELDEGTMSLEEAFGG